MCSVSCAVARCLSQRFHSLHLTSENLPPPLWAKKMASIRLNVERKSGMWSPQRWLPSTFTHQWQTSGYMNLKLFCQNVSVLECVSDLLGNMCRSALGHLGALNLMCTSVGSNVSKHQCRCTSQLTSFCLHTTTLTDKSAILTELRWLFQSSDHLVAWPRETEHWALTISVCTDIASASWHFTLIDEVTVYIRYSCLDLYVA